MRKGILGLLVVLMAIFSLARITQSAPSLCALTGNLALIYGAPAANQRVAYKGVDVQNAPSYIIPGGSSCSVFTDANGALPTSGNCTSFVQKAKMYVTIGSGQPTLVQVPEMVSADLDTLIMANTDPPSLVTDIVCVATGGIICNVTNPGTGSIGTATITIDAGSVFGAACNPLTYSGTADQQINACTTLLASSGGIIDARGYGTVPQTIAATTNVGTTATGSTGFKGISLILNRATVFNCTITDGTDCIDMGPTSSIIVDTNNISQPGGIYVSATAHIGSAIKYDGTGIGSYVGLRGVVVHGTNTTVADHAAVLLNWIDQPSSLDSVVVFGFPNQSLLEITGPTSGIVLHNMELDCGAMAGCTPLLIQSDGTHDLANIWSTGAVIVHPGAGQPMVDIEGFDGGRSPYNITFTGTQMESSSNTDIGFKLNCTRDVTIDTPFFSASGGMVGADAVLITNCSNNDGIQVRNGWGINQFTNNIVNQANGYTSATNTNRFGFNYSYWSGHSSESTYVWDNDLGNIMTMDSSGVAVSTNKTNESNPAQSGWQRMTAADQVCWRNQANSADVCLKKDFADHLTGPISAAPPKYTVAILPSYSQAVLANTPGGYWKMGESSGNFADSSGNSNTATANVTWAYSQTGPIIDDTTTAAETNTTASADVASAGSLPSGDTFTCEGWVKFGALGGPQYLVGQKPNGFGCIFSNGNRFQLIQDGGIIIAAANNGSAISDTTTYHYFGMSKTGSTVHLVIDGVENTVVQGSATIAPADATLRIGARQSGGDTLNGGTIGQVAVYSTALTVLQMQTHYQEGIVSKYGQPAYASDGSGGCPITGSGSGAPVVYTQNGWCLDTTGEQDLTPLHWDGLLGGLTSTAAVTLLQDCTTMAAVGSLTKLTCTTDLNGGTCTTAPSFSSRDTTSSINGSGTVACSNTAGTVIQGTPGLSFAAGDQVCLTRTVNGGTCTAPVFSVSGQAKEP